MTVQQQILRLQVPVDDIPRVEIIKCLNNTRRIESRGRVIEVALVPQNSPQFTAQTCLHQHIKVLSILERLEELHHEVTISLAHYTLLGHYVLLLACFHYLRLLHLLQCK